MISFYAYSFTLLSAAFSLGGITHLYIRYRTRILMLMLLFLLSLLSISAAFWLSSPFFDNAGIDGAGIRYLTGLFRLLGGGLNIIILPHLVSALLSLPIPRYGKPLLWIWNSVFVLSALTFILFPFITVLGLFLMAQQIATIFGSLLFMGLGMRSLKKQWWRHMFHIFFIVSACFLLLLVLDVLISNLPIPALRPVDNLSLPLYITVLNIGVFYFSGRFLSKDAMIKKGKLTAPCVSFYNLTGRETQIIESLLLGQSNKQIADVLCISVKTVENHLYNIYQKTDVGSRIQLLHTLQSWGAS